MKSIKELCHKNLRYAVRKTSLGVGSVAIAFVLAGSLPSQLVQADEWDDYMNSVLFPDVGGEGESQPSGAVEAPSEEVVTEEPMVNEELKALQEEAKDIFTFDEGEAQSTTGTQGQLQGNDAAIEGSDDIFDQSLELGQGTDNALKLDDYINTGDKDTTYFLWNKYDTSVPENSPGKKAIILQQDGSGRTILYRKPDGSYGTFINGKDGVSQGQASNDQWENIALVIDQENKIGKFYLNGEFDSQVDLGNNVVNETTGLIIGAHKNPGSQDPHPFRGQIDDLQIFERVLTDDEVSLLYSEKAMAIVTRDQLEPLVAEVSRLISSLGFNGSTQEGQVLTAAFDQARKQAKDLESLKIAVTNLKEAYRAYQNLVPKPVTIDSEDVLRTIDSSSIFGINHRYAFNGYGSFDPETGQIRDDFKTLFDQVDFGSFRYPGGTISNLFNWKTAIGPVEGRKDQIHGFYNNPGQGGIAANFGLPELISFADQADSEIVYVYSLARGNAQDVADLMEYFNAEVGTNINGGIDWAAVRAQDGHPDPINVRFFEIGNEMQQGGATGDGQWSQQYWVQFVPGKTPVEAYIDGGTAVLNRQYAVKEEDWNRTASYSDGTANQVFYMRYANVNPKMLDTSGNIVDDPDFVAVNPGSVQVFVNGMDDWSEVSNFDNSRATDKHYVIDYSTGFIHFGDGVHGQIPGRNQQITVSYSVEKDGFNAISQSLKDTMKAIDEAEGENREANVYTSFESSGFIDLMRSRDTEDLYDGMTIHPYSGTVSGGSNTAVFYDNAMKKAEDVGIQHVQDYVNMLPEGKVPVISEFGIFRNTEPQVRSLTGALYTAKVMMSYVTLGSPYIQRHTLVDWYSSGADSLGPTQQAVIQAVPIDGSSTLTGEGEFDFFLTPSALVIEMYNDMLGNDIINAQVEGIEKLENGVNPVNVLVSKDEEGNVYIAAVNVARDMDYVLDLNIRGINLDGKLIDVQELTADDIAGENTLENPNAVQIKRTSYLSDKDSTFTLSKHSFVVLKINQALVPGPALEPISDQEKLGMKKVISIDAGRKYFSPEQIKAIIDKASDYGYTDLHLLLGNDGLRFLLDDMSLEVDGQSYSSDQVKAAIEAGTNAYYNDPNGNHLTQAQMDDILAYAASKDIDLIPAINSPGHMDAILVAMENLGMSQVKFTYAGRTSSRTVNLENQAAVNFTKALVDKYASYFEGKASIFSIGLDEFANDSAPQGSNGFRVLQETSKYGLFVDYANALSQIVESHGMRPMAFNDGIYYNNVTQAGTFDKNLIVSYWTGGWSGYTPASSKFLMEQGHDILNTNDAWYYVVGRENASIGYYNLEQGLNGTRNTDFASVQRSEGADIPILGSMVAVWADVPRFTFNIDSLDRLMSSFVENNADYFPADYTDLQELYNQVQEQRETYPADVLTALNRLDRTIDWQLARDQQDLVDDYLEQLRAIVPAVQEEVNTPVTEEELVFEQVDPEQLPNDGYVYSGLAYKGTLLLADTYTSQRNISQDDVTSALSDPTYLDKVFTIYPSPQSITYREGVADLTGGVQLIIGQGVDVYTINLAKKVLQEHQISYTLTDVFDPESTLLPILLGVLERSQAITGQEANPELFESDHYDAYSLSIAPSSISILGATSDGVFYGLQSLEDMLSDSDLPLLRSVLIEDYADVKNRGFIEGYYGEPWSVEDRIALMKFGGEIKMNAYYFAPKDDPYHDSQWRQLYPEHELEAIEEMARIGNETKNRFVWTIHPFQSQRLTFGTAYQGDLQIIKDKFDQLMAHGVRQFGVLADDIDNVGDPNNYVRLMTDLTNFLKERQATYSDLKVDMIFVAPGYTYAAASGANYTLRILNRNLPDTVDLTLTGGKVFGEVSNQVLDNFTDENGNQYKPIHMWINWPVNDQSRNTLIMGGAEYYLKPGLDPAKVAGIMLNPMMESEPSKVALFNAAEYTWNIWDDEAHVESQRPAQFAFVDHGDYSPSTTSEALDLLASNLAFNGGQADVYAESVYLKKPIADFQESLTDGSLTAEEVNQLARYFRDIKEAAELYLTDGNSALVDQMRPFLLDAVDKMTALVPLVENAINLDSKNQTASTPFGRSDADAIAQIYKAYTIAKDAYAKSLQHNFVYFQAGNEIREAEFGVEVITPFLSSLLATYENQLNALFSNRVKGAIVETEGLIEETGEETADLGNAIDANLETAYSSASSDGQILYHLSQDPQLTGPINQVVLITRIDEGVQATLTAILEDGSSLDLGQIRDGLNLYNTQQNVTDLSLNWTGGTLSLVDIAGKGIPSIQEVISNISQELKNNQLNQESKDALAYLLTKANSLLENSTSNLEELNTVQSLLEQSLSSLFNSERIPASEITARNDASELLRANQPITNAFDDNPETQWHTNWDGVPMEDMTIYATLDQPSVIDSIRILARPLGNKNGVIQVMDVYGSLTDDPADAFLIAQGIQTGLQAGADRTLPLDNDKALKMLIIKPTATDGESASLRNQFASAREISFTRLIANDSLNSELLASIEALRQSDQKEAEEADIDYSSLDALIDSYDLMTSDPRFTYLPVGVKDQITHFISNRELIKENPEVTQDLIDQTTTVLQQLLQNYQALLEQIVIPDTGDQGGDTEVPVNPDTDDQSGDTDVPEKPDEQDPVVDPDETVTDKGDPVYTEPAPSFDLAADDDNDGFTNGQELTAGSDYQDPTSQPVSDTPIDEPETTVTDKGEPAYVDPAPSFDLAADDDNDGFTNGQELAAGSDYQDP
ncbi:beta-N-acetylglucosaminidase domain-containing protein, partial [Streptococcus hyovaginalis]